MLHYVDILHVYWDLSLFFKYVGSDVIVASSSTGSVALYKHHTSSQVSL